MNSKQEPISEPVPKVELEESHTTRFVPNPVQRGFILSQAPADLFSSRFGEGKSAGLAWACFYHAERNPAPDAFTIDVTPDKESA